MEYFIRFILAGKFPRFNSAGKYKFSTRQSQRRLRRFPAALQLTLLIAWRSLSREESSKICASTIFLDLSRLAELIFAY
jgi:hypothetical protein